MDNKEQKQNYLFQQIIEANYDPEQFQEFMFSYKQAVDDLDAWTMEDLIDVVQKFKQSLNKRKSKKSILQELDQSDEKKNIQIKQQNLKKDSKQEKQSNKKSQSQSPSKQQQKKQQVPVVRLQYNMDQEVPEGKSSRSSTIVLKQEGKYLQYDYKSRHEVFSQTIDCILIEPNSLLTKNVQIKIEKFLKKEGGLFSQAYVCYVISTPLLNAKVQRRYNDFQWLKKHLELLHPGMPVPPIAKKGKFRRYDDKHLWKRAMILEMFLNKLMEVPQLKAEFSVQNFLKITDKAEWQKYKVGFKGLALSNLKNIKNMKGKINLSIQPTINTFLARSQRNLNQTQPQLKRIYKDFKTAASMLEGCGQTLKGIAKTCEQLDKKESQFRQKVELKYCLNNIFTCLADATTRLAQQLEKQAKTFRQLFHPLIKYQSLHTLDLLDNFDTLAQLQRDFQGFKSALIRKKLKLYEEGNLTKWGLAETPSAKPEKIRSLEIMLPKETKQLEKLRQKYALHNFQMYEELNRFYSTKNFHIGKYLQQYCKQETRISSEMMMIWVDMQTNVISMRQNKFIRRL